MTARGVNCASWHQRRSEPSSATCVNALPAQQTHRPFGSPLRMNLAGLWRYRVGDYRLVCRFEENRLVVFVIKIRPPARCLRRMNQALQHPHIPLLVARLIHRRLGDKSGSGQSAHRSAAAGTAQRPWFPARCAHAGRASIRAPPWRRCSATRARRRTPPCRRPSLIVSA